MTSIPTDLPTGSASRRAAWCAAWLLLASALLAVCGASVGSTGFDSVLHMHGELLKIRCNRCRAVLSWESDLPLRTPCPACGEEACLRPDIVLFEEMPYYLDEISRALSRCSLFVSIGTSGHVYPAAGFAREARAHGARLLELNLEPSLGASAFHESRYGKATEIVPAWVKEMLG